jgi:Xaa-Pro aminopeptidase
MFLKRVMQEKDLGHHGSFWLRGGNMEAALSLVVTGTSALAPTYTDFPIGGIGLTPSSAQGASGAIIGESFVIDFIGTHHGYNSDSTRTFFINEPETSIKTIYAELTTLLNQIKEMVILGVTGEDVWNNLMELISTKSWKEWFMGLDQKVKFVGHGIGVELNQLPVIAPRQKIKFENNMTIAIEPKIFIPNYGIIGIENTYLMRKGKLESITGSCDNIDDFIIRQS